MTFKILKLLKENAEDDLNINSIFLKLQCYLVLPSEVVEDIDLKLVSKYLSSLARGKNNVLYHVLPLPKSLSGALVDYRETSKQDKLLLSEKEYSLREAFQYLLSCSFLSNYHDYIKNIITPPINIPLSLEYQIGYLLDRQVALEELEQIYVDVFYSRVDTREHHFGMYSCFDNGEYRRSIGEIQNSILDF